MLDTCFIAIWCSFIYQGQDFQKWLVILSTQLGALRLPAAQLAAWQTWEPPAKTRAPRVFRDPASWQGIHWGLSRSWAAGWPILFVIVKPKGFNFSKTKTFQNICSAGNSDISSFHTKSGQKLFQKVSEFSAEQTFWILTSPVDGSTGISWVSHFHTFQSQKRDHSDRLVWPLAYHRP